MRKLIGFCCFAPIWLVTLTASAQTPLPNSAINSAVLVREVVYNELHDHDAHGYWRYWIERHAGQATEVTEQVETPEGPIARKEMTNGRPLAGAAREDEDQRIERLLNSPEEQAEHRKAYAEDEHRIARILALLPDAFVYDPVQLQTLGDTVCWHMVFHPNPDYPAHSIEARIFHAMSGELWVSQKNKRLVRLDGKLQENVDFGFGILGRLYKDGWFRLERTHVGTTSAAVGDWKTQRLEIHMQGRAMLFKTIAKETSEVRGGFTPVPSGLSLQQAAALVRQPAPGVSSQPVALLTTSR